MTDTDLNLRFSEAEIAMLGKTADALSAYMGAAVLAEVGHTDGAQWVIFARVLDEQAKPEKDIVHVQMGGAGATILGEKGGLDTAAQSYDCAFLWAIEITLDPQERYIRLDPQGEVFDSAPELALLLPFSLQEPVVEDADIDQAFETDEDEDEGEGEDEGDSEPRLTH
jgi:hypothetical protein